LADFAFYELCGERVRVKSLVLVRIRARFPGVPRFQKQDVPRTTIRKPAAHAGRWRKPCRIVSRSASTDSKNEPGRVSLSLPWGGDRALAQGFSGCKSGASCIAHVARPGDIRPVHPLTRGVIHTATFSRREMFLHAMILLRDIMIASSDLVI